nr:hypothetical protein StreXyl84_55990 [Streptomyces sp. Xyl84]
MSRPYERPAPRPAPGLANQSPPTGWERRHGTALADHWLTALDAPGRGDLPPSDIRPDEGGGRLARIRWTGGVLARITVPRD